MAPVKVTFKTVQGKKFELELDSADKVRFDSGLGVFACAFTVVRGYNHKMIDLLSSRLRA